MKHREKNHKEGKDVFKGKFLMIAFRAKAKEEKNKKKILLNMEFKLGI